MKRIGWIVMEQPQPGPRARDHVACRWVHRPAFFSLACRRRRRVSTHGPPCRLLEGSAGARGLSVWNWTRSWSCRLRRPGAAHAVLCLPLCRRSRTDGDRPGPHRAQAPCAARRSKISHTRRVADVLTMVKNLDLLYELFKLITEKNRSKFTAKTLY
jgi:hypothetical protein